MTLNMKKLFYIKLLFISMISTAAFGQSVTLQVVTKTVSRTIPFDAGNSLHIEGEKANIRLVAWDREEVGITIELTAKHPEKRTAINDLEKMHYVAEKMGRNIFLRNYIALVKGESKPTSNLQAKYVIHLPADCPVKLNNYFGQAEVDDLANELTIDSEFSNIALRNIRGDLDVKTKFGDLDGNQLSGSVKINAQRSDIRLSDLKGVFEINARFGNIWINADKGLADLNINADKANVHFTHSRIGDYRYALQASYGKITVPEFMQFDIEKQDEGIERAMLNPELQQATVNISTSFGNIVIGRVQR